MFLVLSIVIFTSAEEPRVCSKIYYLFLSVLNKVYLEYVIAVDL